MNSLQDMYIYFIVHIHPIIVNNVHTYNMLKYRSLTSLQHPTYHPWHGRWRVCSPWCPFSRRVGVYKDKRGSPLAYLSKYWEITMVKFLPIDLSSLFKLQQWLIPKKLGVNMVKSLNTIQHFCKSFCGKVDRKGIAPQLQNRAYSCFFQK